LLGQSKKLAEAARLLARGQLRLRAEDSEAEPAESISDALAAFGLEAETEDDLEVEEAFYIWPENVASFNAWLGVQTQWNTDNGVRTGLNYPGVEAYLRMSGRVRRKALPELLLELQAMETAALNEWNKER
jgi:hypothetical protein